MEKAALVISFLIPRDLVLLHTLYMTKFLQETTVDFFEDRIYMKEIYFLFCFNTTKLLIAILIPEFDFFFF